MKLHYQIFFLPVILAVLCFQVFWLLVWHNPYPALGSIHATSYRYEIRQAALDAWSRNPNPTTKTVLDDEEQRAERHEWIICSTSFVTFAILDIVGFNYFWRRRRPPMRVDESSAR